MALLLLLFLRRSRLVAAAALLSLSAGAGCPEDATLDIKHHCVDARGVQVDEACCAYIDECEQAASALGEKLGSRMSLYMSECKVKEEHLEITVDGSWSVRDASQLCSPECLVIEALEQLFPLETIDALREKCSKVPAFEMILTQASVIKALDEKWEDCKEEQINDVNPIEEDECPPGEAVERDVKGDCISSATQESVPIECCTGEDECEQLIKTASDHIMDRINIYVDTCKVTENCFSQQDDDSWIVVDTTAICSESCQEIEELKVPFPIFSWLGQLEDRCFGVPEWDQLAGQESLIDAMDTAFQECSTVTTTPAPIMCQCKTPNELPPNNDFVCTDGSETHCAAWEVCFATAPFLHGSWAEGCMTSTTTSTTATTTTITTPSPPVPIPTTTTTPTTPPPTTTTITTTTRVPPLTPEDLFDEISEEDTGTVYVIDASKSMSKAACRASVHYSRFDYAAYHAMKAAKRLRESQYFNIITFAKKAIAFKDKSVLATNKNLADAEAWLSNQGLDLGTNIEKALLKAYSMENADSIHLLSDGLPVGGCKFKSLPCWKGSKKRNAFPDKNGPPIDTTLFIPTDEKSSKKLKKKVKRAREFMKRLAKYTGGTFREPVEKVKNTCPPRIGNSILVEGCGRKEANGLWRQAGKVSGKQRYTIKNSGRSLEIWYNARNRRWELVIITEFKRSKQVLYKNENPINARSKIPPTEGWVKYARDGPSLCTKFELNPSSPRSKMGDVPIFVM